MKVKQEERNTGRPQLTPERVGGADVFVGTVATVEKAKSRFEERGEQYVVTFKEAPEFDYRINRTGLNTICTEIGDDTDEWEGEKVPLVKTRTSVGGNQRVVFQVAPGDEWPTLLRKGKAKASAR